MDLPGIRSVTFDQPFTWLREGAQDLIKAWRLSLFYGVLYALLGYGMVQVASDRPHLTMALISGFVFIGPLLATVFYCLSHRLEHGHKLPKLFVPLLSWRANPGSLGLFAVMLLFVLISWERLSAILVGLFLSGSGVSGADLLSFGALQQHTGFVLAYLAFGAVSALLMFSLTVVSLPMMLHRKVDFATALVTSLMATKLNFPVMLLWAVIIGVLVAIGMATNFIALAVIFPWLGHASWHAYRELIERE
jgi:uncharacterized membrane protein